jgi:mannose-6-phosphate isomerase-like protein (cupin superfamily)
MKYLKKADSVKYINGAVTAYEYPIEDNDINCALVKLNGRYPSNGWINNKKCKELVYVISGSGKLTTETKKVLLNEGDMLIINPLEKYYFEGELTLLTPCTPPWSLEQTEIIK